MSFFGMSPRVGLRSYFSAFFKLAEHFELTGRWKRHERIFLRQLGIIFDSDDAILVGAYFDVAVPAVYYRGRPCRPGRLEFRPGGRLVRPEAIRMFYDVSRDLIDYLLLDSPDAEEVRISHLVFP